jgi:hypothetical protein
MVSLAGGRWAKPPDPNGDVAGEAPLRVFRYASASPFHLTRYETNPNEPAPKDPQRTSTNLTKYWQRKGDYFNLLLSLRTRIPSFCPG